MNAIIQSLNSFAGLFSMLIVFFAAFFASKAMSKSKVNEEANNAQQRLMDIMKDEVESLRRKVDDTAKDNTRLRHTIETIVSALKKRGLVVTVEGEMVNIVDGKGSTTVRIQEEIL